MGENIKSFHWLPSLTRQTGQEVSRTNMLLLQNERKTKATLHCTPSPLDPRGTLLHFAAIAASKTTERTVTDRYKQVAGAGALSYRHTGHRSASDRTEFHRCSIAHKLWFCRQIHSISSSPARARRKGSPTKRVRSLSFSRTFLSKAILCLHHQPPPPPPSHMMSERSFYFDSFE